MMDKWMCWHQSNRQIYHKGTLCGLCLIKKWLMEASSHSYLFHVICTTSFSMSSASPFSKGSAIMVILFLSITSHRCHSACRGSEPGGRTERRRLRTARGVQMKRSNTQMNASNEPGTELNINMSCWAILFVWRLGKALQRRCLHNGFTERDDRVCNLWANTADVQVVPQH